MTDFFLVGIILGLVAGGTIGYLYREYEYARNIEAIRKSNENLRQLEAKIWESVRKQLEEEKKCQ